MNNDPFLRPRESREDCGFGVPRPAPLRVRAEESPRWVAWVSLGILVLVVLTILSVMAGCAGVSEKYGEIKSRTLIGIGVTKSGDNWYGPVTFTLLDEPAPEEVPRVNQEIVGQK